MKTFEMVDAARYKQLEAKVAELENSLRTAQYLLAVTINYLNGYLPWGVRKMDNKEAHKQLLTACLKHELLPEMDEHHAPACRANNWAKMVWPTGPCTCGAKHITEQ